MSPKKSTSKKSPATPSSAKKAATPKEGAAKKPQPLTVKPDQMDGDVLEFIQAIDDYKRNEGRPFPTWSEILEIVKELGYERIDG